MIIIIIIIVIIALASPLIMVGNRGPPPRPPYTHCHTRTSPHTGPEPNSTKLKAATQPHVLGATRTQRIHNASRAPAHANRNSTHIHTFTPTPLQVRWQWPRPRHCRWEPPSGLRAPSLKTAQADTKAGAYPKHGRVNSLRVLVVPCNEAAHPQNKSAKQVTGLPNYAKAILL